MDMLRFVIYGLIALAVTCEGGWLGIQRASTEIAHRHGTWTSHSLPAGNKADHFVSGSSHFVYVETEEGEIFSESLIYGNGWEVVTSTTRTPSQSWYTGNCVAESLPAPDGETLPEPVVELVYCTYNFNPETGDIVRYALLEDNSIWLWVPKDQDKHPYMIFAEAFIVYPALYAGGGLLVSIIVIGLFELILGLSTGRFKT
ncbi:MAG: hypothetical protein JXR84_13980 [Anaerolineae bacterium]|nr:hypothetical protein [Anaerolineae bacterium]